MMMIGCFSLEMYDSTEAVDAGRPYAQLQEAGLRTARLHEIIRQKDQALKEVVEKLARRDVREATRRRLRPKDHQRPQSSRA
jgi:hypothetical protein